MFRKLCLMETRSRGMEVKERQEQTMSGCRERT